ncbi:hypothetical protein Gotur_017080 [Gossypium turneri]
MNVGLLARFRADENGLARLKPRSNVFPVLKLYRHFSCHHVSTFRDIHTKNLGSKAYGDVKMQQIESYKGPNSSYGNGIHSRQDLSCYSASHASTVRQGETQVQNTDAKFRKGKSGCCSKSWSLNDPELQRKKRVASYKVYDVEGRVKGSLKKSFRWLKDRYTRIVYGSSFK